MADPNSSQSVQSFVWFIADHLGKTDPATFGWDYFKGLGANGVHLESSHGTIRDLTVSGERPLGVQLLANAQTAANRGEPTDPIWPSEGSPGEVSAFALLKDAKSSAAGQKWLDFVLSTEGPVADARFARRRAGAQRREPTSTRTARRSTRSRSFRSTRRSSRRIASSRRARFHEALGR